MAEKIVVVGGGTMGAGIALVAAKAGFDVEIVEPDQGARDRAAAAYERDAQRSGDSSSSRRIVWKYALERSDAVLAIEAVPERFHLKREVFAQLDEALPAPALLATNTSSFSVAELADEVADPRRVVGMHFFNPPQRMQLVEVVATERTGDAELESALLFVERLGKRGIIAADTPGFIVNRVARPYYLQSLRALELGVASAPELDALARGVGFRMGPFELMDLIGLDVNLATSDSVFERTLAGRFEPVELQRRMVAQGRLGRKTGAGFYEYRDGNAERLELTVPPSAGIDEEEVVGLIGYGGRADELAEMLAQSYRVVARVETDDRLAELPADATILIDASDGAADRSEVLAQLDASYGAECVIIADAYASDLTACAARLRHSERLAGYGVLGLLSSQATIELVDLETASDDTLELAQDIFAGIGRASILVEDVPGLFLGRTVGSIVNEAMIAVAEDVASAEDVDEAMMLGANYPIGPVAWGREIGGARLRRILKRLADADGEGYAPHRSLWVLDMEEAAEAPSEEVTQ
ncbi:MAG TPA: 3-hydroxyacyl-CoA dehydrogenase NAD-binding domain-containing protein [Candidatus Cybelea sp.]|jgi:3-hydroxybutyryl-CoA dehydrogenase|nr:3-hydroxyacyl-CoA dehydrogenase NAD-binding domain-containing protein [Candidatus Cybelea sp.]